MPTRLSRLITAVVLLSQILSPIGSAFASSAAASATVGRTARSEFAARVPVPQADAPAATSAIPDPLTVTVTVTATEPLPLPALTPIPGVITPESPTSTTEPPPVEPTRAEPAPTSASQESFQAEPAHEQTVSANDHPILPPFTLQLSVDAEPRRVAPGEPFTYTISAIHTGQEPLQDLEIRNPLPDGVVPMLQSLPGFEYDRATQTLIWRLPELRAGAVATNTVQVRARARTLVTHLRM